ncbi:MAG: pyridoxal-phosphate dependent enzyme [Acidimicrobiales bacterium]|nr:pyridoxal-phosphate dependent enzyme [Acidimicrobiales bacterium]
MHVGPPPRLPLAGLPTPLQPLPRLGRALGFDEGALWVKRDDLTALAGGGNKARKLEHLVADALARGADTLVTGGASQSNHVRMTGAAARAAGLRCVAVLGGLPGEAPEGNLLLDALLGIELVWAQAYDGAAIEAAIDAACTRLATTGVVPYPVPLGGASPVGTLGYVRAADEIAGAAPTGAVVYTATGTGGTQAGLVVGFGDHDRVRGVDVGALPDVDARITELVAAVAELADRAPPAGCVQLDRSHIGAGYGDLTPEVHEAIHLAAATEGLVLDPVYSGKALAGLMADRRRGLLAAWQPTVFLHTGGLPSLFTDRIGPWLLDRGS